MRKYEHENYNNGEDVQLIDDDNSASRMISEEEDSIIDKRINASESNGNITQYYTFSLAMGNAADAVEIICVGYIMNEMDDDISTQDKELLSAAVFIGMLFGGLLCGILSDKIGRKPCLVYSLVLNTIAGLASAFTPNIAWLIVCRVVAGIGIGGSVPSVFTLGAEVFPAHIRGKLLSVIASFWMVGAIFTGLVGWIMLGDDFNGDRILPGVSWRPFAVVCSLPAAVALVLTITVLPESPRFLVNKKRFDEAAAVLTHMSGVPVDAESLTTVKGRAFSTDNDAFERSSFAGLLDSKESSNSSATPTPQEKSTSIFVLFSKKLLPSTLVYMFIWFTLSFGSYGISTWITVLFEDVGIGNVYASAFIFALANLPGNIVSILYVEQIGRRRLLYYGMLLAGVSTIGFAVGTSVPALVVICATLFNAFSVAGWNALDCMSVENFPTEIRTSAMGVLAASGRIGAISAQFVNGSLEENVPVLLFVTSGCMIMGGIGAKYTPVDTSGAALVDHID
mmetsp:Transcript_30811/g.57452  ORF Transcript_30811/g.57452 Transcript_30811/m.57452 type:complete len:509 (-) Transcript_30811:162-1688(-)